MDIIRLIPLIAVILFCSLIFRNTLQLKRNKVILSANKPIMQKTLTALFLALFLIVFIVELAFQAELVLFSLLPGFLQMTVFYSSFLSISGSVVLLISILLLNYTFISFKRSFRFGLDKSNLGELVTERVFKYTRNPFFVSIILLFLGITMFFTTPFFIGITLLSILSIHWFILKEEKFMHTNYGNEYLEYCNKVRRYF